jgi:hypothetical protein
LTKKVSGDLEIFANASKHVLTTPDGKNIFFENKFLVIWKYAKMLQNTFLTTPDGQKYLFGKKFLLVWKYAQMHKKTFLTIPDSKKYLF